MADKTIVIRLAVKAGNLTSGLQQAAGAVNNFAVSVERGASRAGNSVRALGAASAFAGKAMLVGIGGAMAVSAQAAIEFESSLAGVAKTVDFAGSRFESATDPVQAFGEVLRNMALRTPIGVNDLARIAEVGGQLGVEADNLAAFTEVMAALGVSTTLSAEEAATGLARFANIMGTPQTEFDVLGSIIVELGNNLATTEGEILTFATRIAAVGQTVGASEADVLALAGALSSLGIPAERGGTAVQQVFITMAEAIDGAGEKLDAFAKVAGMSGEAFSALFAESPARAFEAFVRGLDSIAESGGSVFRTLDQLDLDAVRTTQVLLAAAGGADVLTESIDRANTQAEDSNALWVEAAKRYGTTESQIKLVANAFNDLRIEIGNMLLDSGGLVAAMDFLKEFFAVIKNNLDTIGSFVEGLTLLAGLRIGMWMAEGVKSAIAFAQGLKGAATAARALGIASATLNVATLGAVGAVIALGAAWANTARRQAEYAADARTIVDQIQAGTDAIDAFKEAIADQKGVSTGIGPLFESEFWTDKTLDAMRRITGYSEKQFLEAMLKNRDILADLGLAGEDFGKTVQNIVEAQGRIGEAGAPLKVIDDLDEFLFRVEETRRYIDEITKDELTRLSDAFKDLGFGEASDSMAEFFFQAKGFGGSVDDIKAWLEPPHPRRWKTYKDEVTRSMQEVAQSWEDLQAVSEGGGDRVKAFWSGISDAADGFNESMGEAFQAISEEVRNGMPVWDEYEQVFSINLTKINAAMDLFLKDMTAWTRVQSTLVDEVSPAFFSFLSSLEAPEKGFFARLYEQDRAEFDKFRADWEANNNELNSLIRDRWLIEMPTATKTAMAMALIEIRNSHDELTVEGAAAFQALVDGFNSFMAANDMNEAIQDLIFTDAEYRKGLFAAFGFELGAALLTGIVQGMVPGPEAKSDLDAAQETLRQRLGDKWELGSPSRVTMRMGADIAKGLQIGIESNLPAAFQSLYPQSIPMPPTPIVNVSTPPVSRSAEITINNPQTQNLDRDLSYGATIAGLMTQVGG